MRVGYACINTAIGCTSNSTFRLKSYSDEKLTKTIRENLICLKKILAWNKDHNISFFRLGSQLVPFASHPVCKYNWQKHFEKQFKEIGSYIKINKMRLTMHPDQFVIINSKNKEIVERSVKELEYHCDVLDLMKLGPESKIVLHVGGVYNEKEESMKRFVENYKKLPARLKKRIVIENDHRSYSVKDCLEINNKVDVPVIFDNLHHACLNNKEPIRTAILSSRKTWQKQDGPQIVHYSDQAQNAMSGSHSKTINLVNFKKFLTSVRGIDLDVMLEVKDKEQSALKANKLII